MLESTPLWTLTTRRPLTQWYGHVHLLPHHVVGQWFCADRVNGKLLWERRYFRPNQITGFSDGVIVASETRSDGPWGADFGCYGIDLGTGRLRWTSHGSSFWGPLMRALDFVPAFTNEFRDLPLLVEGGECLCGSGRVLDPRTGRQTRRMKPEDVRRRSDERRTIHSRLERDRVRNLVRRCGYHPAAPGAYDHCLLSSHEYVIASEEPNTTALSDNPN